MTPSVTSNGVTFSMYILLASLTVLYSSKSLAGAEILNFVHVRINPKSEDFRTKWRPLVQLSEHISNTIFRMKATVPALP